MPINATDSEPLIADLYFGMTHPEVIVLQKLLNKAGFILADSGPGSPGNETPVFGMLTRDAVRRFQCAKEIACSGDEYSNSYGLVESRTRAALVGKSPEVPAAASTRIIVSQTLASEPTSEIATLQDQIAELTRIVVAMQRQISLLTEANYPLQ